ncbi:MAG: autoinducer binding domain-containing protein [Alphaproteobacteria bacterium]|nr:autoinducer binding domain-containing protein [Alphaproteobacteria bacterium]MBU0864844.1 autoinducer binding domain-containing protein [Alphaproteobacteria bacterium]MBU1825079.1 autoinducer binding domain-containing protein [Alphaproteobacteria bacterium]
MSEVRSLFPDHRGAFGRHLVAHRKRDGRSQLVLALDAGVSCRHLGFLETGRAKPSADMVARLAGALRLSGMEQDRLLLAAGLAPRFADRIRVDDMTCDAGTLGTRALDAAVGLAGSTSVARSTAIAAEFFGEIGIDHFITGTLRWAPAGWDIRRNSGGRPAVAWLEHNQANRYRNTDYLVRATAVRDRGFFWSDIPPTAMSDVQQRILAEGRDFRILDGFVLPIPVGDGSVRAFSSWGERVEANVATRTAASLVARALVDNLHDLNQLPAG